MRNPHVCHTPPRGQHFGAAVRALSHGILCKHGEFESVVGAVLIHDDNTHLQALTPDFWGALRSEARVALRAVIGDIPSDRPGLVPEVFRGFAAAVGDPDTDLAEWHERGAPMGITHAVTHRGVFPQVDEASQASRADAEALARDADGWENYRPAESDPGVCLDILGHMVNQGWADVYPSVLQARVASELWEASFVAGFGASPALELRREGLLFWLAWFPGCARSSGGLWAATAGRAPPLLVAKRPRNHRLLHMCCNFGAVGTHSVGCALSSK